MFVYLVGTLNYYYYASNSNSMSWNVNYEYLTLKQVTILAFNISEINEMV